MKKNQRQIPTKAIGILLTAAFAVSLPLSISLSSDMTIIDNSLPLSHIPSGESAVIPLILAGITVISVIVTFSFFIEKVSRQDISNK